MILGTGIDVVDIPRMERALASPWAERLLARVFSLEEIQYCRSHKPGPAFAARYAAKEAFAKALGTGFTQGLAPFNIVVIIRDSHPPSIELRGKALAITRSRNVSKIHLSMSHSTSTACAIVIVES